MTAKAYTGDELTLFSKATNWKRYCASRILPLLGNRGLEVGAGLAETTRWLCSDAHSTWLCLEPDEAFCQAIQRRISAVSLPACCTVLNGTIAALVGGGRTFYSILHIVVLEHFKHDRDELQRAARLLGKKGAIIILSPAYDFLFSLFDSRIGHYRRYNRRTIRRVCPGGLSPVHMEYLDSAGMMASLANRWLLGQAMPTAQQIAFWDNNMVRLSVLCDPLLGYCLGKSILAVMQRDES
jgi:hypothetical protein